MAFSRFLVSSLTWRTALNYSIGKVRAVKFTIYIILITHISGCVWFLDACFARE